VYCPCRCLPASPAIGEPSHIESPHYARRSVHIRRCQHELAVRCMKKRSAHPTQLGGGRAKPCRRVVLSGNTRPGRKPRRAHTHGVDRGETPRATNTSCVTGSLLARIESLEATLTPRPLIQSVSLGPSEDSPQTSSKDPRKTLLRYPQKTLGKPSSDTLKEPSENPPLRAHWAHNPEDGRSFEYRLE